MDSIYNFEKRVYNYSCKDFQNQSDFLTVDKKFYDKLYCKLYHGFKRVLLHNLDAVKWAVLGGVY